MDTLTQLENVGMVQTARRVHLECSTAVMVLTLHCAVAQNDVTVTSIIA